MAIEYVAALIFGTFILMLVLRVPVAFALGIASLPPLLFDPRVSLFILVEQMYNSYNSFLLLAVPFFLLAANVMNAGTITDKMLSFSRSMVGHMPGSLAQMNVVLSVLFAGVSGSSTADAASQSKIFIPAMVKEGYDKNFSVANTAVSSVLSAVIPPSIIMVIWAGTLSISVGQLYIGGILPGIMLALAMMVTVHIYAKMRNYPRYERATFKELLRTGALAIPAMGLPFIIAGGKIFGWFTATEAAAVASVYAIFLAVVLYRAMDLRSLGRAFLETGKFSAISLFCLGTASVFGWLLAYYKIPTALLSHVVEWEMGLIATGFFIAFVFLIVGAFLDAIPAIVIVGAILQPLTVAAGMDPMHYALIGIVSLAFGLVTPPYGLCLLIACAASDTKMRDALKDTLIMLVPLFLVLVSVIIFPSVYLWLPNLVGPDAGP
ncbi:TRAP transporter large permease [Xinfangfangia sp. CPCC 101601]|uniref:TRAP transporter large permease protein n=1 Tax=Pseudogemmobacter lacusdianii TaxID=3069608 RepID=A0ABU0VSY8_9RHOB|nr:TRAP transporter large permease [Xinfangfangia sp. CPCC 101601]MDQ2064839.1 TRAP transporter large permease [Xinfangfangia sp. CPCC 101601]